MCGVRPAILFLLEPSSSRAAMAGQFFLLGHRAVLCDRQSILLEPEIFFAGTATGNCCDPRPWGASLVAMTTVLLQPAEAEAGTSYWFAATDWSGFLRRRRGRSLYCCYPRPEFCWNRRSVLLGPAPRLAMTSALAAANLASWNRRLGGCGDTGVSGVLGIGVATC